MWFSHVNTQNSGDSSGGRPAPPLAGHRTAIVRHLGSLHQCDSRVLAFNINTISDRRKTPLPQLLLSQFYQAKGYSSNFLYARVIEAELDKHGKLAELHAATERLAQKPWADIQKNLTFFANALYQAACEVAGDAFKTPEEVPRAITEVGQGEQYNVQFLVRTRLAWAGCAGVSLMLSNCRARFLVFSGCFAMTLVVSVGSVARLNSSGSGMFAAAKRSSAAFAPLPMPPEVTVAGMYFQSPWRSASPPMPCRTVLSRTFFFVLPSSTGDKSKLSGATCAGIFAPTILASVA